MKSINYNEGNDNKYLTEDQKRIKQDEKLQESDRSNIKKDNDKNNIEYITE